MLQTRHKFVNVNINKMKNVKIMRKKQNCAENQDGAM